MLNFGVDAVVWNDSGRRGEQHLHTCGHRWEQTLSLVSAVLLITGQRPSSHSNITLLCSCSDREGDPSSLGSGSWPSFFCACTCALSSPMRRYARAPASTSVCVLCYLCVCDAETSKWCCSLRGDAVWSIYPPPALSSAHTGAGGVLQWLPSRARAEQSQAEQSQAVLSRAEQNFAAPITADSHSVTSRGA